LLLTEMKMKTKEFSVRIDPQLASWVRNQGFSASELVMRIGALGYHGKVNLAVADPGSGSERVTVRLAPRALSALREMTASRQSIVALRKTIAAGASARLLSPASAPKMPALCAQPGQIEREGVRAVRPLAETPLGSFLRDSEPLELGPVSGASLPGWITDAPLSTYADAPSPGPSYPIPGAAPRSVGEALAQSEIWKDPYFLLAVVIVGYVLYKLFRSFLAGGSTASAPIAIAAAPSVPDAPWTPASISGIAQGVWQ
jgi:hypothetical protein